ncbi:MAG: dihydrofolate reductase [Lachnospiraceae bacterium]
MNLIAAVDKNWGIGNENKLLVSIPDDMRFFREVTTGKVVVMGRKTLESFPEGRPLKNRTNIVLSGNPGYAPEGVVVVHNPEELQAELKKYDSTDIYVVGGEKTFSLLLDQCDTAYITRIDYAYRADAHFPNLDEKPEWQAVAVSEEQTYYDLEYKFYKYKKIK